MGVHICGIDYESMVDGEGVRAAIFLSGCSHHCPGCHNPEAQNPTCGQPVTDDLITGINAQIEERTFLSGITLTGGDPMYDPKETLGFLKKLRLHDGMNIWLYTGYTYEEIMADKDRSVLFFACDVVVDGRFEREKADKRLRFRGSSNQRIIDVPLSSFFWEPVPWKPRE